MKTQIILVGVYLIVFADTDCKLRANPASDPNAAFNMEGVSQTPVQPQNYVLPPNNMQPQNSRPFMAPPMQNGKSYTVAANFPQGSSSKTGGQAKNNFGPNSQTNNDQGSVGFGQSPISTYNVGSFQGLKIVSHNKVQNQNNGVNNSPGTKLDSFTVNNGDIKSIPPLQNNGLVRSTSSSIDQFTVNNPKPIDTDRTK